MAFRTLAKALLAAAGVAALAGAGQLGLAYGLGVLRLAQVFEPAGADQWAAQLAWIAWLAAAAATIGSLVGDPRPDPTAPLGLAARLTLALAGGVGAAVVAPLTMQPARAARLAGTDPMLMVGLAAGLGALVGVLAGYAALASRTARRGLSATIVAVWLLALGSLAPSLRSTAAPPQVRLGVLDVDAFGAAFTRLAEAVTMPALSLALGVGLGWAARRAGRPRLIAAMAGAPGAALLATAYLIAGPGVPGMRFQGIPYWASLAALGTGVLGSTLPAVLGRRGGSRQASDATPPSPTDPISPTDPTFPTGPDGGGSNGDAGPNGGGSNGGAGPNGGGSGAASAPRGAADAGSVSAPGGVGAPADSTAGVG